MRERKYCSPALTVSKSGLAAKLAGRPKAFCVYELVQNAWDEPGCTRVDVTASMLQGNKLCRLVVEDNAPEGFAALDSVYTLFKESKKGHDARLRGRFELGEKLVAALATKMEVTTTKGTVVIEGNRRWKQRRTIAYGSRVTATLPMTLTEFDALCVSVGLLIAPPGITTRFNGEPLRGRNKVGAFAATLQTVLASASERGVLRPTRRKASVLLYAPEPGEQAYLYELGIPVMPTGDRWHYDVGQRVPLNWERQSVPPSYLQDLRVHALNAFYAMLGPQDGCAQWVLSAIEDPHCCEEAVRHLMSLRFGKDAVTADPSDPEGTKLSASQGRKVVPGGAFSAQAWQNIRRSGALPPAGKVTPSPKPYGDGPPESVVPRSTWSADMVRVAAFSEALFKRLTGGDCQSYIVNEPTSGWAANFQRRPASRRHALCLNLGRLGHSWFFAACTAEPILALLLHEFAHAKCSDHLSAQYHAELCSLGARLAALCLHEPQFFLVHGVAQLTAEGG